MLKKINERESMGTDEDNLEDTNKKNKENESDKLCGTLYKKCDLKIELFCPIAERYLSEEFEINRNKYLDIMKEHEYYKRIKYIYEVAIDLLLYCLTIFPYSVLLNSINDFYDYFYEFEKIKREKLIKLV